jgi:hypothetical protein
MDPTSRPLKLLSDRTVFRIEAEAVITMLHMAADVTADARSQTSRAGSLEDGWATNLRRGDVKVNHAMDSATPVALTLLTPDTTLVATITGLSGPVSFRPDTRTPEGMRLNAAAMARTVSEALSRITARPSGTSNVIRRHKPVHARCMDRLKSIACWSAQADGRIDPAAGMTAHAPTPWSPPSCSGLRTTEWMEEIGVAIGQEDADAVWGRLPALLSMELENTTPHSVGAPFRKPTRSSWSVTLRPVGSVWQGEEDPMEILRLLSLAPKGRR